MRPQNETVNQIKMQQMNTSKKKILILFLTMAFAGSVEAQIFNNGAEGFGNRVIGSGYNNGGGAEGWGNINIDDGLNGNGNAEGFGNLEIYSPIGSGLFLLAGMAGAYALMRRRKGDEE